ncbi:MAG TPA: ATP-binding protein [Steroidobacteraceae bacterium]|nr:ATP-binding protein [Steroidobacteraceae bacterium]
MLEGVNELQMGNDVSGILDALTIPIVLVDRDTVVTRFNHAARTALGLSGTDIGLRPSQVKALASIKDIDQLSVRAIADGADQRSEFHYGERWFAVNVAPCKASNHQISGAVITCTNVTAFRASVEQALYEREYTKAILNTVSIGLVVLDSDLRVQTANRAFYELFDVSRETATGTSFLDPGHDWKGLSLRVALEAAVTSNTAFETFEIQRDLPNLGCRVFQVDARKLSREESHSLLLAVQDITDRKRAEEALRVSEERHRLLFTSMDEGFCTIEVIFDGQHCPVDYRILEVNNAFEEQTGIKDAKGKLMRELFPLHEQRWFDIYGQIALTGEPARFEEFAAQLGRWYDVYAFRVGSAESRQVAVLFSDVTPRVRDQEALRDADRRKDEFLATLAHELRNPLAPVRNWLEIMKRSPDNPALLERARTTIDRQMLQMERLVDDLLDISRIHKDKLELRRARIDLTSILHQAVETCRHLAERANHTLTLTLPPAPIYVDGDGVRLAQLVCNLLNNACKYTEQGGHIGLSLHQEGDDAIICVKDSGVGIPSEMLGRIFEMFTQVDSTLEKSQGGLGIGLTLVKRLVEMHGGNIEAFSEGTGLGSEFRVRLPLLVSEPSISVLPSRTSAPA